MLPEDFKGVDKNFVVPLKKNMNIELQQPLQTKFTIPRSLSSSFVRKDLNNRLDTAKDKKLIIISAPAGYGKTCLLSDWLSNKSNEDHIAWISLDRSDNDLFHFWMDILSSMVGIGFLSTEEMYIIINNIKNSEIENAFIYLINKIFSSLEHLIVILENYHYISDDAVLHSLNYFIEHMPENIHFVFTGRNKFPLPIAKMQINDQVLEIGVEELCFSLGELTEYLNSIFEARVSPEFVSAFNLVTEGWIVAVKAIAEHMKNYSIGEFINRDPEEFIHCIFQYIREEIAAYLPVHIHTFLTKTSILYLLQGALCDNFVENNSLEILRFLERDGFFTFSINSEKTSFRYHYIFRKYWNYELECMIGQDMDEWYQQSIIRLEEEGAIENALYLAMHKKLYQLLGDLLVKHNEFIFLELGIWRSLEYFEAVPDDILKSNPILCMYHVISLLITRKYFDGVEYMQRMGISFTDNVFDKYILHKTFILTQTAIIKRDYRTVFRYTRKLNEITGKNIIEYAINVLISRCYLVLGYDHKAEGILKEVLEVAETSQNTEYICIVIWDYAILKIFQGKLNSGIFMITNIIKKLPLKKRSNKEVHQLPELGLSLLYYEMNDIDRSYTYFQYYVNEIDMEHNEQYIRPFFIARIYLAQNKRYKALKVLLESESTYKFEDNCLSISLFIHSIARVCIALEEKEWIKKIKQYISGNSNGIGNLYITESIALADILLYEGDAKAALETLSRIPFDTRNSLKLFDLKINILKAISYRSQAKNTEALKHIRNAVIISGECGFVRSFIDYKDEVKELLLELLNMKQQDEETISEERGYILKLLSHFGDSLDVISQESKPLNTLNGREAEILRLICLGYSNQRIAELSYVSVSLVKKIKTSIFRKLGVTNRAEVIIFMKKLNTQQYWEMSPK